MARTVARKKRVAGKAAVRKAVAPKPAVKKPAVSKPAVKKPAVKKTTVGKPAVKKAVARQRVAKTSTVKKSVVTKSVAKPPAARKAAAAIVAVVDAAELTPTQKRAQADRRAANVLARRKTKTATERRVADGPVVVDDDDEAAKAAIARLTPTPRKPRGSTPSAASSPVRRTAVDRAADPPVATGIALIERVTRAIERELSQIEVIVGGQRIKPGQRTEAERRARTLASLARTLTEVRRLRADENLQRPSDDADAPRNLDDFRRKLWARLEGVGGAATPLPDAGDD